MLAIARRSPLALLLAAVNPGLGFGLEITVSPDHPSYSFVNLAGVTAIDFEVKLVTLTGPGIDPEASSGGPPFPTTFFSGPPVDGGWGGLSFVTAGGGSGVGPSDDYTISFPGWPDGTIFDVSFTYPPPPIPGIQLILVGDYPTEGVVLAAPEPSTWGMTVLGFTTLGFAGYRRARRFAQLRGIPDFRAGPAQ
jgi:hypothetical protein